MVRFNSEKIERFLLRRCFLWFRIHWPFGPSNSSQPTRRGKEQPVISPTSLANRAAAGRQRRQFVRPPSVYRRLLAPFLHLKRRSQAIAIALALFLFWKFLSFTVSSAKSAAGDPAFLSPSKVKGRRGSVLPAGLPFAPTQVRRTTAKIRFKRGAVQEVFVPPLPKPTRGLTRKDAETRFEELWDEGEVNSIELPLGATLRIVGTGTRRKTIEKGDGDACEEDACQGIQRVALEQDILVGLRQIAKADASKEVIVQIPGPPGLHEDSVTLVTQFSLSRLSRFARTLREWDGPISAAIYLTDATDIQLLQEYLTDESNLNLFRSISLALVKPDYSLNENSLLKRLRYPINKLRNLALDLAPTPYVVVTDADFVPSPNMHSILRSRGVHLIRQSMAASPSPTLRRTAIVVSAFALAPNYTLPYPSNTSELATALFSHPPSAFLTDKNAGHGPSLPSLLVEPQASLLVSPLKWPPHSWYYDVCYEPQWEPYYLLHRASHPLYDERFTDQGGDKQSHALLLNALGYEFKVIRDAWFMHPPKGMPDDSPDLEKWPSVRLVDPNQEPHDEDPSHFSPGQKDSKRFRYFEDYIPELESVWGGKLRWPKGCEATVVGVRTFGRARAGVMFGL